MSYRWWRMYSEAPKHDVLPPGERWLTLTEAAERLGRSKTLVALRVHQGRIKGCRIGKRIFVAESDVKLNLVTFS